MVNLMFEVENLPVSKLHSSWLMESSVKKFTKI